MNRTGYTILCVPQTCRITSITRQGGQYLSEMPRKQNLCAALGAIFADKTITVPVGRAAKLLLSGRVPTAGGNPAFDFRRAWAEEPSIRQPVQPAKSTLTGYKANRLHNSCLQSPPSRSECSFHATHGGCNRANYWSRLQCFPIQMKCRT